MASSPGLEPHIDRRRAIATDVVLGSPADSTQQEVS
jgi:hypothetical protein